MNCNSYLDPCIITDNLQIFISDITCPMPIPLLSQLLAIASDQATVWNLQVVLRDALATIHDLGSLGAIAFIGLYIVATVAFFPGILLTLGAGVLFGVVWGSLYVFIGATLGAIVAFLVGRYLTRRWVYRQLTSHPKFQAIDRAMGKSGLKIVLLTRLSPLFPFNFLNYAYGVTSVTLKDYAIASIGMLPGTVLYVYMGSLAGDLASLSVGDLSKPKVADWAFHGLGFFATVAVTLYVTRIARQALQTVVSSAGE
ncbi:TVP38/TMEM64 family protein [Synechococcus elongatus]|uniref:TVP38/TMEM64 family membrane protein n=1 Tax=Synechococcus elongatus PCC 11801 TaxID=2219813 RepID=A0AAN1QPM0_SYNEL|nr:TVP38/TMEM64 family protein [Synechococcus elongatus]